MIDHAGKFDAVYAAMRPKAVAFKAMATEQEVDQPRVLVEAALKRLAATILIPRGYNEATQREAVEVTSEVVDRLLEELFPMICR